MGCRMNTTRCKAFRNTLQLQRHAKLLLSDKKRQQRDVVSKGKCVMWDYGPITSRQKPEVSQDIREKDWNKEALVRLSIPVWRVLHRDGSLFIHQSAAEPELISLQVLVLLGLVQSTSGCKYIGLQEALAHLQSADWRLDGKLPRWVEKKCTVVFLCHYVCTNKSLNLLRQIKIAPVAGDTYTRTVGFKLL